VIDLYYYGYKLTIIKAEKLFLQCLRCDEAGLGKFSFQGQKYLSLQGTFFIAFRQQAHSMTEAKSG